VARGLVAPIVFRLDRPLRRRRGVFEFSSDPDCIFRAERKRLERPLSLVDGTRLAPADTVIDLHLWNEQVPVLASRGATVSWAGRMNRALDTSLRELARFMRRTPGFEDVRAVRAELTFGTEADTRQLLRICGHYGFQRADDGRHPSRLALAHRQAENMLIALLVLARNPRAFRWSRVNRTRVCVVLPRAALDARYREAGTAPG
jgi:hypothetical protein